MKAVEIGMPTKVKHLQHMGVTSHLTTPRQNLKVRKLARRGMVW